MLEYLKKIYIYNLQVNVVYLLSKRCNILNKIMEDKYIYIIKQNMPVNNANFILTAVTPDQ